MIGKPKMDRCLQAVSGHTQNQAGHTDRSKYVVQQILQTLGTCFFLIVSGMALPVSELLRIVAPPKRMSRLTPPVSEAQRSQSDRLTLSVRLTNAAQGVVSVQRA